MKQLNVIFSSTIDSDNSTWGRDDDEAGLVVNLFVPNATKLVRCSARLASACTRSATSRIHKTFINQTNNFLF